MRRTALPASLLLCATVLFTGCHHASKASLPTAAAAPPTVGPVMVSVPPPTHRDRSDEVVAAPVPATATAPEPVRRPSRSTRRSAGTTVPPPASIAPATTANTPPTIALGELSAGGEVSSGLRQQTADLLKSQQQRIDSMNRVTATAHPTEIAQARTFLQHANDSWNAADYEGAHTLAVKAKVLLDDLKQ